MTTYDPQALREKYRIERDKRLRPDGNDQYVEMANAFAHYLDDPYCEPIERPPLADDIGVVVIGGGFGGLLMGARLVMSSRTSTCRCSRSSGTCRGRSTRARPRYSSTAARLRAASGSTSAR